MKMRDENQVLLSGDIPGGFIQTHEEFGGAKMYTGNMVIFRKSNPIYDIVPVIVSEEMYRKGTEHVVSVIGEMRSRRILSKGHKITLSHVRATDVKYLDKPEENDVNEVYLIGKIAFEPIIQAKSKKNKLARIILNIERGSKRFDSICCQLWNEDADRALELKQGQKVKITGRFHSYAIAECDSQEQIYVYADKMEVL